MKINTGQGSIPLISVLAIWSISSITALPGLAVTPILGDLDTIFTNVSDLDIQMISSFPNLFIIPFVLLSGKMSQFKNRTLMLRIGLSIFLLSAVLYMFAKSIISLILISCLLGIGAGMVTPLSLGLVANFFVGKQRTRQMGISSGVNNLSLVLATIATGWLAAFQWQLPFMVYFLPAIALILSHFLSSGYLKRKNVKEIAEKDLLNTCGDAVYNNFTRNKELNYKFLFTLMAIYFILTYVVVLVSYNISFVLQNRFVTSVGSGWVISVLFLAIMIPGFFVTPIIQFLKNTVFFVCLSVIVLGFLIILFFKNIFLIAVAVFFIGIGYGVLQPLIYDKASLSAKPQKAVLALACIMSANYLAIYLCPFIASGFQIIFGQRHNMLFPFWINMLIASGFAIFAFFARHTILFSAQSSMFHSDKKMG